DLAERGLGVCHDRSLSLRRRAGALAGTGLAARARSGAAARGTAGGPGLRGRRALLRRRALARRGPGRCPGRLRRTRPALRGSGGRLRARGAGTRLLRFVFFLLLLLVGVVRSLFVAGAFGLLGVFSVLGVFGVFGGSLVLVGFGVLGPGRLQRQRLLVQAVGERGRAALQRRQCRLRRRGGQRATDLGDDLAGDGGVLQLGQRHLGQVLRLQHLVLAGQPQGQGDGLLGFLGPPEQVPG